MSVVDLVVGVVAGLGTVAAVFGLMAWLVGRQSEERRGGTLELDTPAARRALVAGVETPRTRDEAAKAAASARRALAAFRGADDRSALRRCNPERRVHYHGSGDTCECGAQPNTRGALLIRGFHEEPTE